MQCPHCRSQVERDMMFCPECGKRVIEVDGTPATQADVVQPSMPYARVEPSSSYNEPPIAIPPLPRYSQPSNTPNSSVPSMQQPTYIPPQQSFPSVPPSMPTYTSGPLLPSIPNSTMAIASLILGILGWMLLPVIGPLGAIITGHMARSEIRKSDGRVGGAGMALAGLVLGYSQVVLFVIGICIFIGMLMLGLSMDV